MLGVEMTDNEAHQLQELLHARHHAGQCGEHCPWCYPDGLCSWWDTKKPETREKEALIAEKSSSSSPGWLLLLIPALFAAIYVIAVTLTALRRHS